uniref:NKAP domain containing 1 n=1 Tax=Salarias fasciatus TaxID=181472 RepID=A0A672FYR9_SALFA
MAKQPMGKTLLRNVIRHTDAHNKIQEEMEMWKMRDWEVQMSHHKQGHMHCDRVSGEHPDLGRGSERMSEHDDREARYWTRKLYDFEANDPDRWGHSGFKELYPEEFESDGEKHRASKKTGHRKLKKSKSDTEACLSKRSKKASRKKKKKKKKRGEEEKRRKAECWSSDGSSDDSSASNDKQRRRRTKSRHKNKKAAKSRGRDEDSSSGDSGGEAGGDRRTHGRKRRRQDSRRDSDSGPDAKKKRRKDWKAAGEESSDESSAD